MLRAIREEVDALYIEGTRYRKTGIVFFGLEKPGTAHQTDLFDDTPASREIAPVRRRGRPQRPLRQGQGLLRSALASLGVFASPRVANPRKGRLRPGPWRKVVAHEAAETLQTPDYSLG